MIGVLMLVNEFWPLPSGGAEKQAERLAEHLGRQGLRVSVLTRGAPGLPAHEPRGDFRIERIPPRGPGKIKSLSFVLGAAWTLARRRREYDVLHAHLAFAPALVAAVMGRLLGKPVVVKFGTSGPYGDVQVSQRTWRGRLRLALLRRWVDVAVALSQEMETEMLAAGFPPARVRRMPNGIDAEAFRPGHDKAAGKSALGLAGKTLVLYVGRLAPQKALPALLTAVEKATAAHPALHLMLLGDGPERPALERLAHDLKIDQRLTFAGNVGDVRRHLDAADVFVLPSQASEGISNALLEAMAAGLACVATSVGGSPEVLDGGACGVLVPPDRPDLLSEALTGLADNPAEAARLGALARQRILAHYTFEAVGEQYRALYQRLLTDRRAARRAGARLDPA